MYFVFKPVAGNTYVGDFDYFEKTCQKVIQTRESLVKKLMGLGFDVLPSGANFIFAKHPLQDGAELAVKLREKSIIVRHFKSPSRIAAYLRITIGTDEQSKALISALKEVL